MSENEKKEIGKTEQNRPNREKTRKMLTIYALVFIGVVLLLVLVSWGVQMRENQRLEDILEEQQIVASGVAEKYDNLRKENDKLIANNKDLQNKVNSMDAILGSVKEDITGKTDAEAADLLLKSVRRAEGLQALSELQRTYRKSTKAVCRVLIAKMEQECYSEWFTKDELTEYNYIKKQVNYISK